MSGDVKYAHHLEGQAHDGTMAAAERGPVDAMRLGLAVFCGLSAVASASALPLSLSLARCFSARGG